MYRVEITDEKRIWYFNGEQILEYYYDSGFSLEDCILCWYYISTVNVQLCYKAILIDNREFEHCIHYKSKLDPNVIDNMLYTPCDSIHMYKYDPHYDGNESAVAKNYYDIFKFFASESDDTFVDTYDGKRIGKLRINRNIVNNIPVYETKYWDGNINIGLRKIHYPEGGYSLTCGMSR